MNDPSSEEITKVYLNCRLPENLISDAKEVAAEMGMTLTSFVGLALKHEINAERGHSNETVKKSKRAK